MSLIYNDSVLYNFWHNLEQYLRQYQLRIEFHGDGKYAIRCST